MLLKFSLNYDSETQPKQIKYHRRYKQHICYCLFSCAKREEKYHPHFPPSSKCLRQQTPFESEVGLTSPSVSPTDQAFQRA